jgi:small subunit ribosomal protein S13
MVRISGVILPGNKQVQIALTAIKGVGRPMAIRLLTEGDLTRKVSLDIKRLQDIGTWRGHRHKKKLPVRGQTSRRNARTKRGKRKTGLSGRTTLTKT